MKTLLRNVMYILISTFVFATAGINLANAADSVLRVGNEGDYPPFTYKTSDGTLQGFDIEFARALCTKLEMKCEFSIQAFKGLIPALKANRFDIIVSSMTINDDRRKQILFSDPYYDAPYTLVTLKGKTFTIDKAGMSGKVIGVVGAGAQRKWLEDKFGDVATIKSYETPADIRADMVAERIDATMGTMPYLYGAYVEKGVGGREFEFAGEVIRDLDYFGEGAGLAVQLGNEELAGRVNKAIDEIYTDGTFARINHKYFPFDIGRK